MCWFFRTVIIAHARPISQNITPHYNHFHWTQILSASPNDTSSSLHNSHNQSQNSPSKTFEISLLSIPIHRQSTTASMSAINKIVATSPSHANPSELENSIATALYDLESNTPDLKAALRPLQFSSAKEVSSPFFPLSV